MLNGHVIYETCQSEGSKGGSWVYPDPPGLTSVFAKSIQQSKSKNTN